MENTDDLINFWQKFGSPDEQASLTKIHPDDRDRIPCEQQVEISSFANYCTDAHYFKNTAGKVHTGLYPIPYIGDLKNASVYFLLLNSGVSWHEYFDEEDKDYRAGVLDTLYQHIDRLSPYPFFALRPELCWTDAGMWWHNKLKKLIERTQKEKECSYLKASRYLAANICALELFPYHSRSFSISNTKLMEIQSVTKMIACAKELEKDHEKLLIVMRGVNLWDLGESDNIISFPTNRARSGCLSEEDIDRIWEHLLRYGKTQE